MESYTKEKAVALEAVQIASKLCTAVQASLINDDTIQKKDRSPVTVADFGSQAIVISFLRKAFPEDVVVAEESSKALVQNDELRHRVLEFVKGVLPDMTEDALLANIDQGNFKKSSAHRDRTRRWWTLDPVDGTLGFLRRGQYCVALALFNPQNEPVVGVLGCPNLPYTPSQQAKEITGCMVSAVKGHGTYVQPLNGEEVVQPERLHVQNVPVAEAVRAESFEKSHSSFNITESIAHELGATKEPLRLDSQCKYAIVALSQAAIYLRLSSLTYQEKIWDHAAGALVVEEAGGRVTDLEGKRLDFSLGHTLSGNLGVCGSNGFLHEGLLQAAERVNPRKVLQA